MINILNYIIRKKRVASIHDHKTMNKPAFSILFVCYGKLNNF